MDPKKSTTGTADVSGLERGAYRLESDSLGEVRVPAKALFGAQTQRACENFPVSGHGLPLSFIRAIIEIKRAAARANQELGQLPEQKADAIVLACDFLLARIDAESSPDSVGKPADACDQLGEMPLRDQFPVDIYQTGSGTSTNMNVNEVLAHLSERLTGVSLSANDDVNMGQSSNDVIPSAIHVSAYQAVHERLLPALDHLETVLENKRGEVGEVLKTGRTHLMDAVPMTLGQEMGAWQAQVALCRTRLQETLPRLSALAQGGTAIGTGLNAHPDFSKRFCQALSANMGVGFHPAENSFAAISGQDTAAELSGGLKGVAVALMKIANDLRWMNSGPLTGLHEIELRALQPGSSIMPGKVNPVIPESAAMVAARVMGNDTTIMVAAQSGNFQLNVMLPLIAATLLESIQLLSAALRLVGDKAIGEFQVNSVSLSESLSMNPILVTALNPVIGYEKAAQIAKRAYREHRPIIDVAREDSGLDEETLSRLLDPRRLVAGGMPDEKS